MSQSLRNPKENIFIMAHIQKHSSRYKAKKNRPNVTVGGSESLKNSQLAFRSTDCRWAEEAFSVSVHLRCHCYNPAGQALIPLATLGLIQFHYTKKHTAFRGQCHGNGAVFNSPLMTSSVIKLVQKQSGIWHAAIFICSYSNECADTYFC